MPGLVLDANRRILQEMQLPTTPAALRRAFLRRPTLITIEAGTHSHWVSHLLEELGHRVLVANPRKLHAISHNRNKGDRSDARTLAQLGAADAALLAPIAKRDPQQQLHLSWLRARAHLLAQRAALLQSARGLIKPHGARLPRRHTESKQAPLAETLAPELRAIIEPMLELADLLSAKIRDYDSKLEELAATHYPAVEKLRQVRGVGLLVALTFVLVVGDPNRFHRSRQVGPYTGTTPRRAQSGKRDPQLGITKQGDAYLRAMLTQSAQYILGRFGEDCDLRRWGLRLCERGGKNAKKRAVTAVARKLAVLLHRLWTHPEPYDPLYNARQSQPAQAAA